MIICGPSGACWRGSVAAAAADEGVVAAPAPAAPVDRGGSTVPTNGIAKVCSRNGLKWATCWSYAARRPDDPPCPVSANNRIGRYFCAASAVTTAELIPPLLRMIARSFAILAAVLLIHRQNHLQHPRPCRQFHRLDPLVQPHPSVDQTGDVDALFGQGAD